MGPGPFFAAANPFKGVPFAVINRETWVKASNHRTLENAMQRAAYMNMTRNIRGMTHNTSGVSS